MAMKVPQFITSMQLAQPAQIFVKREMYNFRRMRCMPQPIF